MKTTIKKLQTYAYDKGIDPQSTFADMLDFFIRAFNPNKLIDNKGDMALVFREMEKENPILLEILFYWLRFSDTKISENGVCDFFGELYESMFLGKSKASGMGQFFTPMPLCQVMVSVLPADERMVVNEPSCGSGRNVLAHWQSANKLKLIEYRCEDLDPLSVKMCALNMMINGMYGRVICHDSLDPQSFHFGYAINEIRYPIPSPYYSIRELSKEGYLKYTTSHQNFNKPMQASLFD